jgi:hypothetical protein
MSVINTAVGGVGAVAIGTAVLQAVLPGPAPIVVHQLSYEAGIVTQDRTVTTNAPVFFAKWRAQVVNVATGDPLRRCTGGGTWNYKSGRAAYSMPLSQWVGSDACPASSLPEGAYRLIATWSWGDEQTHAQSPVFAIGAAP